MRLFRRKKKNLDYAAIRIGNVYVLPPDEEDVREFNRKRRRELTRRGFVMAGAAAAVGAVTWLVWPGRKTDDLDPQRLLEIDAATADKDWLRKVCILARNHPDENIRYLCAGAMISFPRDPEIKKYLWEMIRGDASLRVRNMAMESLIQHYDAADIAEIVKHYHAVPSSRPIIDEVAGDVDYTSLQNAIAARVGR